MIRFGILGGADIAYKMFLPAMKELGFLDRISIASNNPEKRDRFVRDFGIRTLPSYEDIINDQDIDAVYIPLPPALHYQWAKAALKMGKHVFLEKPSTTDLKYTKELVEIADRYDLALQENYMFQFHSQMDTIKNIVDSGRIGKVRMYKGSFG